MVQVLRIPTTSGLQSGANQVTQQASSPNPKCSLIYLLHSTTTPTQCVPATGNLSSCLQPITPGPWCRPVKFRMSSTSIGRSLPLGTGHDGRNIHAYIHMYSRTYNRMYRKSRDACVRARALVEALGWEVVSKPKSNLPKTNRLARITLLSLLHLRWLKSAGHHTHPHLCLVTMVRMACLSFTASQSLAVTVLVRSASKNYRFLRLLRRDRSKITETSLKVAGRHSTGVGSEISSSLFEIMPSSGSTIFITRH